MSLALQPSVKLPDNPRALIEAAIAHLDHILPAQAPIQDFVHHNTLHGYQHLPFFEALAEAEKVNGIRAFLPDAQYREYCQQGRINDEDIVWALASFPDLGCESTVCSVSDRAIIRKDIYRSALLYNLEPISLSQLNWQIEELQALDKVQSDVPEAVAKNYVTIKGGHQNLAQNSVRQLWEAICKRLELTPATLHPEQLLDTNLTQTEQWLQKNQDTSAIHSGTRQVGADALQTFFREVGVSTTLRDVVKALSGKDILDGIRPQMIRLCASLMDEGVAAWRLPGRNQAGLYGAWRNLAKFEVFPFLYELSDYAHVIADLPEEAIDCIEQQLAYFGLDPEQWPGYLSRIALEIPGWAGMVNWRQQRPDYAADHTQPNLADFLAIRLVMDRLWLNQVCREIWKIEGKVNALQSYFEKNTSEFVVRRELYLGNLPEYLTHDAETLMVRAGSERQCRSDWQHLADLISIWRQSPLAGASGDLTANNAGWRLFRLSQHLGLQADDIYRLTKAGLLSLLTLLDEFDTDKRSKVWLTAYERHYREELFQALKSNHAKGRWHSRGERPQAQLIMCMDEREESFRRHLEELNPAIETLGAAGFFGIPMYFKGLDKSSAVPLCPVVVTPNHQIDETPQPGCDDVFKARQRALKVNKKCKGLLFHSLRHHVFLSYLLTNLLAPFMLLSMIVKFFTPEIFQRLTKILSDLLLPKVATRLQVSNVGNESQVAMPVQTGFSDAEQAQKIAAFLKVVGLTTGFAPVVVLAGHGSTSQNNPHEAAHDCGACGGRQGGPNARAFASMANRPEVRQLLTLQNIHIPEDTWFIGLQHDTCSDAVIWYDLDAVPESSKRNLENFQNDMRRAQALSAHERSRRFYSASQLESAEEFFHHVALRAQDYSQVRPEYGHASNAAAVIGKRSLTQGLFLDRRVFLISYDAALDADGSILEAILLTAGPVGAGINLEYYFSTVDNERFGCSTKLPHNLTGLFGVMEGTGSDLRTGLPLQMVEIHEAMRLLVIVEAKNAILEAIYHRQAPLRELIAGGWIQLAGKDPETGDICLFLPEDGFVRWHGEHDALPVVASSIECYAGKTGPVPPVFVGQC